MENNRCVRKIKVKMKIKMMWLRFWLALAFIVLVAHVFGVSHVHVGLSVVFLFLAGVVSYIHPEDLAALMLEGNG